MMKSLPIGSGFVTVSIAARATSIELYSHDYYARHGRNPPVTDRAHRYVDTHVDHERRDGAGDHR
jgi:hypothetical protein